MENKTVLEQAIATIQSSLDSYTDILLKEPMNPYIDGKCVEMQAAIDLLTYLLPTEKQQIVDAYNTSSEHGFNDDDKTGEFYYNETFNKEKA